MDTVFVTGGSSILGHHVLRRLVSRVRVLAVVHRRNVEIPDAKIELLHGELAATVCDPVALQRAQIVLHMAAVTHSDNPAEYSRVNAELTKQLLSVCLPSQHFVYVSTICAHPKMAARTDVPSGLPRWRFVRAVWITRLSGRPGFTAPRVARELTRSLHSHEKCGSYRTFATAVQSRMRRSARRKLRSLSRGQQFADAIQGKLTPSALIARAPRPRWRERSAVPCVLSLCCPCRS